MGLEEAMRLEIEELIEEKTALRAQLMGKTTAEAIKMAFDNGDSYLESVMVRAKQAEADRDTLRAQLAAANSMLGTWEAITRKTAEKDGVQYVGPNTASAISDVATARAEKAEAELKAANERAEKAEAERADALRCSGENAKAWQEAVCDEAVKRTHLLKEIGLTEQQRDALRAQLAAATERAEKAEHLLEVSEDYRRAYADGKYKLYASDNEAVRDAAAKYLPCNEGPLERAVDAVSGSAQLKRLNCALAARVAELEGALEIIDKELCTISEGKQEEIRNDISSGEAVGWTGAHDHVGPIILSALSRTPAQSLAACKAAALREAAKECQEVMPDDLPHLTYNQLMDMAERLEAEAAN